MATIGSMVLLIEAQSAQLHREMARVQQTVNRTARGIEQQTGLMQRGFDNTARSVALLGRGLATLGVGIGISAIVSATKSAISFGDALGDLSVQSGIAASQLQELRHAAVLSGGSAEGLDRGVQIFARRLGEAAAGTGELRAALAANNIAVRDSSGAVRATSAVLDEFIAAASGAESAAERARLANLAFGRGGAELTGILSLTRGELRAFAQDAAVVSDANVEALSRSQDAIDRFSQTLNTTFVNAAGRAIEGGEGLVEMFQRLAGVSEASEIERVAMDMLDMSAQMDAAARAAAGATGDEKRIAQARLQTLRMEGQALQDEMAALQATERGQRKLRAAALPTTEAIEGQAAALERSSGATLKASKAVVELAGAQRRLQQAGAILKQTSAQEQRFLAREEERTQLSTLQAMNDEELRRRTGQATAGGLSRPGFPEGFETELSEPFKNALQDIQSEFTNTFREISQGTIRSFEDMAASAHNIFTGMAANVASLAIFDPAAFNKLAAQSSVGAAGIGAAAFGTPAVGLASGLFGNQGSMQGVEFGGAGGAALGALAGTFLFPGVGTAAGGLLGGLAGSIGGGLLGGLFGGGKDKRARFSGSGGLGGIGGGGEIGRFLQDIDQSLISLLNSRQEELVNAVLRQQQVNVRAKDFDQNVQAFAASQRVGPAAQALGFNAQAVTGGGNIGAQQQVQNLQTALAVQDTIRRLVEPAFEVANEDLANQFEEITATAKRFGVSLDGLSAAQDSAARDLQRTQDAALGSLFDPFRALAGELEAFQTELRFTGLNPAEQAQFAQEEFRRIAAEAAEGSTTALQQLDEAGRLFIQTQNAAGASPAAARATEDVRRATVDGLEAVRKAEKEAGAGIEDQLDRLRRETIDTLKELTEEVRIMARKLDKPRI